MTTPTDILDFWFSEPVRKDWWGGNPVLDAEIRDRFLGVYAGARDGQHDDWAETDDGLLALILLFDQFPRNMFRGRAEAFATDPLALALARFAVENGLDRDYPAERRHFLYMPFMHSEAIEDQEACVALFSDLGDADTLDFARRHHDVVARFGRFPHRNAALGQESTAEETEFIATDPRLLMER
ncbi:MAG: DUF924 family protein [Alphaproteobacteria bacterium]